MIYSFHKLTPRSALKVMREEYTICVPRAKKKYSAVRSKTCQHGKMDINVSPTLCRTVDGAQHNTVQ